MAGGRRATAVEGDRRAAEEIAGEVAECAIDCEGDALACGVVVRRGGGGTAGGATCFEVADIGGRGGRSTGRRLLLDAVALAIVEVLRRARRADAGAFCQAVSRPSLSQLSCWPVGLLTRARDAARGRGRPFAAGVAVRGIT